MEHVSLELTIYFENGFYYGLFEQENAQGLSVCRVTFGVEPQMNEVLEFVNRRFSQLQFSPAVAVKKKRHCANPKRLQRLAKKEMKREKRSTKSQDALKLQQELNKQAKRSRLKAQKEYVQNRKFQLKQQKRKEKHKGH